MPNAWDGLSALLLQEAGFEALGTSAAALAAAPMLPDMAAVVAVVRAVAPKPVNVVLGPGDGLVGAAELARAGVRRISTGVALYTRAMGAVREAARQLAAGDIASAASGMPFPEAIQLIAKATRPDAG